MADAAVDLTDEQIDLLLSEAETRLAARGSQISTSTLPKSGSSSTHSAPTTIELPKKQAVGSQDLTVRVPHPKMSKQKTVKADAGPDWFHMPRTSSDPAVKRDLQILKMRNVLAFGKQHFKKDTRRDPLPPFTQIGTLVGGPTDTDRLTRKERKQTLAEEVLASNPTLSKLKMKFNDIQQRKASGKKAYYKKLVARRRRHG